MEFFFNPESVAVVGASRNPMKFGSVILANLFNLEYEGRIFPVNPKGEDIAGLKTYTSVSEIPDAKTCWRSYVVAGAGGRRRASNIFFCSYTVLPVPQLTDEILERPLY